MAYLLKVGFDPNAKNNFNKTPLMYAAQYNNYESAKLLIESGVVINTGTVIPFDHCRYTLKTANMSPLHYAVRYADKNIISLFLDSGSSIFFDAENRSNYRNPIIEYPIDWLSKFSNKNLLPVDREKIEKRLELPQEGERESLSIELNAKGEKLYANKKIGLAVEMFGEAARIDRSNFRSLNNFSLASLKLGDKQNSILVSEKVINARDSTMSQKASAYFNKGLACESAKPNKTLRFNGWDYCEEKPFESYFKSYEIQPSKFRADALFKRFKQHESSDFYCVVQSDKFEAIFFEGKYFYILHQQVIGNVPINIDSMVTEEVNVWPKLKNYF